MLSKYDGIFDFYSAIWLCVQCGSREENVFNHEVLLIVLSCVEVDG